MMELDSFQPYASSANIELLHRAVSIIPHLFIMATAQLATSPAASAHLNPVFEKVEMELKAPKPVPKFDTSRHLCFESPKEVITLKALLLSEDNAISPVAVTDPFPLFSIEGVKELRGDIFRKEVVEKHGQIFKPGVYKMRGYSKDTPFVDSVWRDEEVLKACSQAAGADLQVVFDYEIAHINAQIDALANKESLGDVLPSAMPERTELFTREATSHTGTGELATVGNWHTDSYPWVCVVLLSDPTGTTGGETGLRKGDGSILKVRGPGMGWAVMMQGRCIDHIALKAFGTGERITMITSFRPKDPLAKDGSTLSNVKHSSRWNELFQQWTTYRLDVISTRALALKERIEKGDMSADEIRTGMESWNEEQIPYLKFTASEMIG
jgi:hypothetical protein